MIPWLQNRYYIYSTNISFWPPTKFHQLYHYRLTRIQPFNLLLCLRPRFSVMSVKQLIDRIKPFMYLCGEMFHELQNWFYSISLRLDWKWGIGKRSPCQFYFALFLGMAELATGIRSSDWITAGYLQMYNNRYFHCLDANTTSVLCNRETMRWSDPPRTVLRTCCYHSRWQRQCAYWLIKRFVGPWFNDSE